MGSIPSSLQKIQCVVLQRDFRIFINDIVARLDVTMCRNFSDNLSILRAGGAGEGEGSQQCQGACPSSVKGHAVMSYYEELFESLACGLSQPRRAIFACERCWSVSASSYENLRESQPARHSVSISDRREQPSCLREVMPLKKVSLIHPRTDERRNCRLGQLRRRVSCVLVSSCACPALISSSFAASVHAQ